MPIDLTRLGMWVADTGFRVEAERIAAYAAATSDDHPRHASGEVVPPIFACVPIGQALTAAVEQILPQDVRRYSVHAEQDMFFHRLLVPGMVVHTRVAPIGVHRRPSGTALILKTETRDEQGDLFNEQYITLFIRGLQDAEIVGDQAPDRRVPITTRGTPPVATIAYTIDADQTYRYADASGDHSRIHIDADFARSVGLPGIIVHGMCTMAFTSRAVVEVVCGADSARLKRLAVRFARPVLPGQGITVRLWAAGRRDGRAITVYDALNQAGKAVIQDGLAEVAD